MTEQSKMPARIWCDSIDADVCRMRFLPSDTLYIRADLVEQMAEALETAGRLFTEIRGDFLDPREVCDEGRETINIALSTYAAAVGSKEATP